MTRLLKRKGQRREKDNYPTPAPIARWVVERCIQLGGFGPGASFLEPGCGDKAPFTCSAIDFGLDAIGVDVRGLPCDNPFAHGQIEYLTDDEPEHRFDIIATNPPFLNGLALSFWERSIKLLNPTGVLGFVVKTSFLASRKRSEVWKKRPPIEEHVLYPRPSFSGDGSTDIAQEYCASFWYGHQINEVLRSRGEAFTRKYWLNIAEL